MKTSPSEANKFCRAVDLSNESSVESFFVLRLLADLGYQDAEVKPKTAIDKLMVGKGRRKEPYKPDYVVCGRKTPRWIIDAKSPDENPDAFERAVKEAQKALQQAGRDASLLEGYTWHSNRHTFASRLVMAGVDLLTVQRLGGWRTLPMVQRYAHLAPDHLRAAVERLASVELGPNLDPVAMSDTMPAPQECDNQSTEG